MISSAIVTFHESELFFIILVLPFGSIYIAAKFSQICIKNTNFFKQAPRYLGHSDKANK